MSSVRTASPVEATRPLSLMCVLAHPDDETLATGGTLARYAAEGVAISIVCATRGERGWREAPDAYPGPEALGRIREAELHAAAEALGFDAGAVEFLDYRDGELDQAEPDEAVTRIVRALRARRPQVVITFGADGAYGHPDHIAISQFTTAAVMAAADSNYDRRAGQNPHRVEKLYYLEWLEDGPEEYQRVFGTAVMRVDGVERRDVTWPAWSITTRIDTSPWWRQVRAASLCHRSQTEPELLAALPDATHQRLWSLETYYRVFSLVNGGREVESDLFAGLR
jgi:LmbE family N-acetylglucosaminyl deacetylase